MRLGKNNPETCRMVHSESSQHSSQGAGGWRLVDWLWDHMASVWGLGVGGEGWEGANPGWPCEFGSAKLLDVTGWKPRYTSCVFVCTLHLGPHHTRFSCFSVTQIPPGHMDLT